MIKDFLITAAGPVDAELPLPCPLVGKRLRMYVSGSCPKAKLLPVYECKNTYRFCSPFGDNLERSTVQPCKGCPGDPRFTDRLSVVQEGIPHDPTAPN